jgi:rare lipoprotein A (peptidoglycan hydrolase)
MTGRMWKLLAIAVVLGCELSLLAPAAPSFADEGLASWYGPGFHGRRMANGEVFNMYDPTTTACNIYPLGTWLRVTNLANGWSITVQVRDRGAFNHALDLSYGAYMALGGGPTPLHVRYEVASGPEAEGEQAAEEETPAEPTATPTPEPAATAAPEQAQDEHVVQAGETLSDIAARYGLTVEELAAMNGIDDPDMVGEGDRLRVSSRGGERQVSHDSTDEGSGSDESSDASASHYSNQDYYHTVQEGETLWSIAADYGLTPEQLIQLNNLSDPESLSVGQTLYVCRQHEVQEGETLGSIALEYGVSVEALMAANGLQEGDFIQPGALLRIPN